MSAIELLSKSEAAGRLSVSVRTLERLIASGQIRVVRIGQPGSRRPRILVKASEIAAFVAHLDGRRVA